MWSFVRHAVTIILTCQILTISAQDRSLSVSPLSTSLNNLQSVRKPRFSFFREFIEPLAGILNEIFPATTFNSPIVATTNGKLRGTVRESRDGRKYFAFLGVPYAIPPVGKLRFEPPKELTKRWEGIRDAVEYSRPCFHMDVFFSGRLTGIEDCLYANIYTPKLKGNLPVMVYIHGGGFSSGSGDFYQPKYFMDENIVFVIFNYRLSALGFLNTEDGVIEGNMGLKDQNMLLRWVQNNIKNFGGDPTKVTLFGESVGAAMTQYHMLSPQSTGLFHKAISLSGTVLSPWAFNKHPAASAKRLAKVAGCPTSVMSVMVKCLKSVPVQTFTKEYKGMMKTIANPAEYFAPSAESILTDDTFMTEHPEDILKKGNFSKMPLMLGISSMEGLLYSSRIMADKYTKANMNKKFDSWIPRLLYYDPNNNTISSLLKQYYFLNQSIDLSRTDDFLKLTDLLSDGTFVHPVHKFAKLYGKVAPTYLYYNTYQGRLSVYDILSKLPIPDFSEDNNLNNVREYREIRVGSEIFTDLLQYGLTNEKPSSLGTSHGDAVFLLFNMRNIPGIGRLSMDYQMSKALVKALTDFASFDSTESVFYDGIPWPRVDNRSELKYMKVELPAEVIDQPFRERMRMWDQNFDN